MIGPKRWLTDPQKWAARLEQEGKGLKPRRRIVAYLSLAIILGALVASVLAPWARDMAGAQGFFLGLLVAWIIWRLAEDQLKDQRFRKTGGTLSGDDF